MNRRLLVSLMALGAVVTLIGGAGIFAVFTDRATTGTNSVTSGERASAADLQISTMVGGTCVEPFVDDLATGLFSISDVQPSAGSLGNASICLMNTGTANLTISVAAIDLVNVETDCTGDEEAAGDASCGIALPSTGMGELPPVIVADFSPLSCATGAPTGGAGITNTLAFLTGGATLVLVEAPGEAHCFRIDIRYPTTTPDTSIQIAQTDQVTWRFAFDGTTV